MWQVITDLTWQIKKLQKKLARLHEFDRLVQKSIQQANAHWLSDCPVQVQNLAHRIWQSKVTANNTLGYLLRTARSDVKTLQADRSRLEDSASRQRLHHWREKMKHADSKTVSKWLRSKEQPMTNANVVRNGQVAQNSAQAAQFIYDHWCDAWSEQGGPAPEEIATQLASTFPTAEDPQQWVAPDMATVTKALYDARGAAGCDGWSSLETQYLPVEAAQHFYRLTVRWYQVAAVPASFEYGRQVNLHKSNKIRNFQIEAAHTRPITVFSIFKRAYATAWMQTEDFKKYATTLPAEISGVFQHEGSEEAATILQRHWAIHGGVMISLDYSPCYDRMNVQATLDFLQRIHWPPALLSQMRQVWNTKRYLEYDNHVHPQILISSGVPQGCPIAPLTLATWMSSGAIAVQSLMQFEANVTAEAARQAV